MRKFVSLFLVILLAGIYYFSTVEDQASVAHQARQSLGQIAAKMVNNASKASAPDSNVAQALLKNNSSDPTTKQGNYEDLASLDNEKLLAWVSNESKSMDSTTLNTSEVEVKLKAMAQTLTPEQL